MTYYNYNNTDYVQQYINRTSSYEEITKEAENAQKEYKKALVAFNEKYPEQANNPSQQNVFSQVTYQPQQAEAPSTLQQMIMNNLKLENGILVEKDPIEFADLISKIFDANGEKSFRINLPNGSVDCFVDNNNDLNVSIKTNQPTQPFAPNGSGFDKQPEIRNTNIPDIQNIQNIQNRNKALKEEISRRNYFISKALDAAAGKKGVTINKPIKSPTIPFSGAGYSLNGYYNNEYIKNLEQENNKLLEELNKLPADYNAALQLANQFIDSKNINKVTGNASSNDDAIPSFTKPVNVHSTNSTVPFSGSGNVLGGNESGSTSHAQEGSRNAADNRADAAQKRFVSQKNNS